MNRLLAVLLIFGLINLAPVFAAQEITEKTLNEKENGKNSYAMGMQYGERLKNMKNDMDIDIFLKGLRDAYEGKKTLLSKEDAGKIRSEQMKKMQEKRMSERNKMGSKNKDKGAAFLKANKNKKGVKTTESGLQYMIIKEGDGPKPKSTDKVKVHYKGTLIDGSEFDSSYSRGQPAVFPANRVIKGWTEALQMMKVGSTYRLFIPPELAYGANGAGQKIGPFTTLIFDVELLGIEK